MGNRLRASRGRHYGWHHEISGCEPDMPRRQYTAIEEAPTHMKPSKTRIPALQSAVAGLHSEAAT